MSYICGDCGQSHAVPTRAQDESGVGLPCIPALRARIRSLESVLSAAVWFAQKWDPGEPVIVDAQLIRAANALVSAVLKMHAVGHS